MSKIQPGTKFMSHGKHPRLCEVIDILTTRNLNDEVVKVEYLCQHDFMGQKVKHRECGVTIMRRMVKNEANPIASENA